MTRTTPTATPASIHGRRRLARFGAGTALALLAGAVVVLGGPGPARAQNLDQMRANGLVCERPDGLLHARSSDGTVQQKVQAINNQRLATYETVARDSGTTVEQVRVVSGEKLQARYGGCP
ncbi:DUF1318 domain-containing protein [Roseospira marina]|nr:DUF1318 domain-containing protein [Roseospira marina]MBB4314747.1 uncharacterized protein YdbL (DUF1318 family) [Roseospira marina]MBB5087736.1 uncharacterized protein YdbL (DUF1318 family) [Roseospira marina]